MKLRSIALAGALLAALFVFAKPEPAKAGVYFSFGPYGANIHVGRGYYPRYRYSSYYYRPYYSPYYSYRPYYYPYRKRYYRHRHYRHRHYRHRHYGHRYKRYRYGGRPRYHRRHHYRYW